MTLGDDLALVQEEIQRCLTEAGKRLHPTDIPEWNKRSFQWVEAQFFMHRVSFLERIGTAAAATYLREEVIAAFRAAHEEAERQKALKNAPNIVSITDRISKGHPPAYGGVTFGHADLVNTYQKIIDDAGLRWPEQL